MGVECVRTDVPRRVRHPVVVLRPQYVYEPGQRTTFLIPHVITALLDGRSPQLSTGERLLDCVYADACSVIIDMPLGRRGPKSLLS